MAKRSADSTGAVQDQRRESVTISVPLELRGAATSYTQLGQAAPYTAVAREQGRTILGPVELRGGQISIIEVAR